MDNSDIAGVFREIGDLLELTNGNPFKVRAYRQAAQVTDTLSTPLTETPQEQLLGLPGIGARIAAKIAEMLKTGHCKEHDRLAELVPSGVLELLRIEGVGPKTVAGAWRSLGVTSVDALEQTCADGRLAGLPRMGALRVKGITDAIQRYRARRGRMPVFRAFAHAEAMLALLRKVHGVQQADAVGSLRRRRETIGDIDILVAADQAESATDAFVHLPGVAQVVARGPTRSAVRLESGLQVDLRVVPAESYGAALHYFTGSKTHNIAVRARAVRMGLKLNEYGIFDDRGRRLGGRTEDDVFRAVGLPWIPPELREGTGEIEAAAKGELPDLVEESDLRGDLHVHSDQSSDGRSTVEEILAEAARLGRRYIAITDHSKSRPLGLDAAAVLDYAAAMRALRASHPRGPRLLAGVEVDILPDGSLDLPPEVLARLDWVVASIHSRFHDDSATITRRLVTAMRSGVVDVIGHPTGRLLGSRDPYEFDLEQVLDVARETGVAMELNAQPDRLDLKDLHCRLAREHGVRLAVSSDAHHVSGLSNLKFGVWVARRAWLEASDIVNTSRDPPRRASKRRPERPPRERPADYEVGVAQP